MSVKRSIAVIMGAVLLAPGVALAAPQCFQPFTGIYIRRTSPGPCDGCCQCSQINYWLDRVGWYAGRNIPGHFYRAGFVRCDNQVFLWKE